jgi:hypothetical protein
MDSGNNKSLLEEGFREVLKLQLHSTKAPQKHALTGG